MASGPLGGTQLGFCSPTRPRRPISPSEGLWARGTQLRARIALTSLVQVSRPCLPPTSTGADQPRWASPCGLGGRPGATGGGPGTGRGRVQPEPVGEV